MWEEKQVSRKTLSKKFKVFFDKSVSAVEAWRLLPPTLTISNDPWVLAIDGTWLHRNGVVMIYRDITHHQNLFWSYHQSESYETLRRDLTVLVELLGTSQPAGVVSDWKGSMVNGVANYFDHLPHQRCLIHILREAKRWLPKRTPFLFTQELRTVALSLIKVKTQKEAMVWKSALIKWQMAYGHLLKEKTYSQTEVTKTGPKWWHTTRI